MTWPNESSSYERTRTVAMSGWRGGSVVSSYRPGAVCGIGLDVHPGHLGATITDLGQAPSGKWIVATADRHEQEVFDALIATVPSNVFEKMVPGLPAGYKAKLNALRYEAAVVAILELDRQFADAEAKQQREIASVRAREAAELAKIQAEERLRAAEDAVEVADGAQVVIGENLSGN